MYAGVLTDAEAEKWFAQSLPKFTRHYDYTAIMAMPYIWSARSRFPGRSETLAQSIGRHRENEAASLGKTLFKLQASDWRTQKPIPDAELAGWMQLLKQEGIRNFGYYPDDFLNDRPTCQALRRPLRR